ncbi:phage tail domain-containing protein [Listeria booriae]|uniref:phage tail domain-containing protein n=1 Tax=Listeria booriae TaxID=1552123 RepID=UPI0016272D4B|nr:phage tail domain-containing protein [Listeria booriae]MBC1523728.1 phage tail family protein [Listeria booriae]MBC1974565.1 phage tail family protein [Listeria booriae]MBC1983497.1 phage tail family protein [Listeria booriae]MBC2031857.1 phage tail family protein [Listeria booriae]
MYNKYASNQEKYWVRAIIGQDEFSITEGFNLRLMEVIEEDAEANDNSINLSGMDGVLPVTNTFAPFNLVFKFKLNAFDVQDFHLIKRKLKDFLHRREPYFIYHQKNAGMKFAVDRVEIETDRRSKDTGIFTVTFRVYKGYAESLGTCLDSLTFDADIWQAGTNLQIQDMRYIYDRSPINLYNASSDTINPLMRHSLDIALTCEGSPRIENITTGDVYQFYGTLKKQDVLLISGVYTYVNNTRRGKDTNHQVLRLAKGWNDIRVTGVSNLLIAFSFPFIYR